MKRLVRSFILLQTLSAIGIIVGISPSHAGELQKFSEATLINNPANDGDSFLVEAHGKSLHVRLYFVDSPETVISSESDTERIREQTRYFGLSDPRRTIYFGEEAKTFVEGILAKPFTVYTAFANAMGRSHKGRVYAFIITSTGDDLGCLLVKNGFARTHGKGRKMPDGISQNEMKERLRDMETSAMLKRIGIWSESDPEQIAEFRARQRAEEMELQEIRDQVKGTPSPKAVYDLNLATKEELQTIKGIGPVLAERIIAGRPYGCVEDLLKVKGIGPKTLEQIRPYFQGGDGHGCAAGQGRVIQRV